MTEPASQELFCSTGYTPELTSLNWKALPPIVRVLLATDGTVTKSLESYFWEPIGVHCLQQEPLGASYRTQVFNEQVPNVWQLTDELWKRSVCLQGEHSNKSYVQASSVVCFSLLPQSLREGLLKGKLGIGEIIRELGIETYRRVIAVGQTPAKPAQPESVWRVYHLYYQKRVLMQIKEDFNLAVFAQSIT